MIKLLVFSPFYISPFFLNLVVYVSGSGVVWYGRPDFQRVLKKRLLVIDKNKQLL
jgi:hypothetical protein